MTVSPQRWQLPDFIQDCLPPEAARLEALCTRLLDVCRVHGYELVMPPLLEFTDSLITGSGQDLALRTFQLVDQLSGRTLGVRADMTPQVARIDAQLLNRQGVTRLCYCGSVLHTLPASLTASRQPMQLGAELYGHAGLEADVEVIRLLATVLAAAGVAPLRIDVGHIGLFRALTRAAGVNEHMEQELFALLRAKDVPGLQQLCASLPEASCEGLLALPDLYGDADVLVRARQNLPQTAEVTAALDEMVALVKALEQCGSDIRVGFDLADLRGYNYHSGIMFAAYAAGSATALAAGGRYDDTGAAFGRGRPATGFSLDLRQIALVATTDTQASRGAILAPCPAEVDVTLEEAIGALRAAGEVVISALPGHPAAIWQTEAGCDRRLVKHGAAWQVLDGAGE